MVTRTWFDAHLDLAYMQVCGRDMRCADLGACGGPDLPAGVTLHSLRKGGVRWALATIFTEADGKDAGVGYPAGDAEAAHRAGVRQLGVYEEWARLGEVEIVGRGARGGENVVGVAGAMSGSANPSPALPPGGRGVGVGILIEGADPIRSPGELAWWKERGVVAVGMAWAKASRYAGGNGTELGLTPLGRELVREMDRLGVVHDASHLSDRAMDDLFRATDGPIMASHSNCRSIVTSREMKPGVGWSMLGMIQRHLTDDAIREIVRRGGIIGLNLFSPFLIPGGVRERRATIGEAIAHVEHVYALAGDRAHVGLGSDMDGGFSARMLPEGIDSPSGQGLLGEALASAGWREDEIEGFAHGNWRRFFAGHIPNAFGGGAT